MNILKEKINELCFRIIDYVFKPMERGLLTMALPDGRVIKYGGKKPGVKADMTIHDMAYFRRCVLYGSVGFGEAFVDGLWSTPDITRVIEWNILNADKHPTLMAQKPKRSPVNFLKFINVIGAYLRKNTLKGSRKNIADHYDLGNDFFRTFLDPTMTYSSAYFTDSTRDLQSAQLKKYDSLCTKLRLNPGDHVLEIGSGWGGFAIYAAKTYGCHVTTTTISQQQFEYARQRIQEEQLEGRVDIKLCDYRMLTGKYDKIVSIEMIEAVGHKYYKTYFKKCQSLLNNNGMLALQMILFPDHRYHFSRKNVDWIQKHIFPGSLLPSVSEIQKAINQTGTMCLYHYEDITSHYVKTLAIWRETFNYNRDKIKELVKEEEFIRKWNFYWSYCEAAFKTRYIMLAQAVYTKPDNQLLHDELEVQLLKDDKEFLEQLNIN